jgi:hypothetical protein
MVGKLKQCRQIELNGIKDRTCSLRDIENHLGPLYKNGLVNTKKKIIDTKEFHCIYVAEAGIDFLNRI